MEVWPTSLAISSVLGLRDDAMVEFAAQFPELVDNRGFGFAANLAPLSPSVIGVPDRELAAPQPWAVAVAFGVAAGPAVLEGDSVFTATAPGGHSDKRSPQW